MKKPLTILLIALTGATLLVGCQESKTTTQVVASPTATAVPTTPTFKQVERLARPAINEGLILSNNLLNTWNSVGPDVDATSAATPLAAEATTVLKALGNSDAQTSALLGAFVPDVMRIDTTGESGYANALNTKGAPIRGRKITDDVIDITLAVVVPGGALSTPTATPIPNVESDNVSYAGPNAGNTAHKPVKSAFPYLADPN